MTITELSCILEVAADANRKLDQDRKYRALTALRSATIADHDVLIVTDRIEEKPVEVPGFGHNHLCANGACVCDVQPYGVLRYFSVHVFIEGNPPLTILDDYQVTPAARLLVCTLVREAQRVGQSERKPLQKIKDGREKRITA
jgi:hypothetical protein